MTVKSIPVSQLPKECRKRRKGVAPTYAKSFNYWEVQGQSWAMNPTKRDGKRIKCGHHHKSREGCERCLTKMKKERPGKCQQYRAVHVEGYMVGYKYK